MALPRSILFVDGENLTMRYQDMVKNGSVPRSGIYHRPDVYIWHGRVTRTVEHELEKVLRVCFYTSVVGDDIQVADVKRSLARIEFSSRGDDGAMSGQVVPIVYKKPSNSRKTRNVDIQIAIDVMRFACTDAIDRIYLASGDGDYLPLIQEVMRRGKQVEILAFSSGLNESLRVCVDRFHDLDNVFFGPEN